ncbi:2Fe-2S iron-sulfur cluster-binding protein [Nocardia goodfellowii]
MVRPPLFQRATVTRIIKETADARTFVLAPQDGPLTYQAGQFCTFKVTVDGRDLFRSYSMSSCPHSDTELTTTVKRVAGGQVSNWLHDNVVEGDVLEMTRPAGNFVLREAGVPFLGFSGGSGITPILSLAKYTLATTDRSVRLLCADRDEASIIFEANIAELIDRYPGRITVLRHLDSSGGFLTADAIENFVGADNFADNYICGPEAFMELVENSLPGPGRVFSERFGTPAPATAATPDKKVEGTVTVIHGKKKVQVPRRPNETLLESARRGGLNPPFSCEAGNCGTCIGQLTKGTATMRVNDALTPEEVADGLILTCQAVPDSDSTTVTFD